MPNASRVVLLTRSGCHLCDEAREQVAAVCDDLNASWSEQDVDSDPELRKLYSDHVPVLFADGKLLGYWFVDVEGLRRSLTDHT